MRRPLERARFLEHRLAPLFPLRHLLALPLSDLGNLAPRLDPTHRRPPVHLRLPTNPLISKAPVIHPRQRPRVLERQVLHLRPALADPLIGERRLRLVRPVAELARPTPLRILGVVALEELLRPPLDSILLAVREHQMHVRLFAPIARGAVMNRPLIRPARPELLFDKPLNQRHPRRRYELARQRELVLPIRIPIGALVFIGRAPKLRRVLARPGRHVAVAARLDLPVSLLAKPPLAPDVLRMLERRALRSRVDLDVIRGHGLPTASSTDSASERNEDGPTGAERIAHLLCSPSGTREGEQRPIESRVFLRFFLLFPHRFPALRET